MKDQLTDQDYIREDIKDICETLRLLSKMENGLQMIATINLVANFLYESGNTKTFAKAQCTRKHGICQIDIKYNQ